ncbi:MAG: hypothetical protein OXH09_12240 [Gammaproteobacteria bacterium]|nr:hypothetical protein [Gammaproteobacteria bacterium]
MPRIEIRVYDAMAQYDDHRWVADVLAKTLMQFPRLLLRALPERLVIAVNQNGPVFYIGPSWDRGAWWVEFPAVYFDGYRESVDAAMEELLVHELAHVLDHLHNLRNDAGWISESEKDESEVSDYAESNEAEALAETMLAWLALETDNAKYQPELRDVHSDTSAIE